MADERIPVKQKRKQRCKLRRGRLPSTNRDLPISESELLQSMELYIALCQYLTPEADETLRNEIKEALGKKANE